MGNSNTEHSKNLRKATAREWHKQNTKRITIAFSPKNHHILDEFNAISGKSYTEKINELLRCYKEVHNHKQGMEN